MKYTLKIDELAAHARERCSTAASSRGFELRVTKDADYLRISAFLPDPLDTKRMVDSSMYVTISPRPIARPGARAVWLRADITASICGEYGATQLRLEAFTALHDLLRSIYIRIREKEFEL